MSPKIWTLIAGASLGMLAAASACTVTSVSDDDNTGGSGATTTTTTTSNGGSGGAGVGGSGGGGGEDVCVGCNDYLYPEGDIIDVCGLEGDSCDPGSSCETFADLWECACGDGVNAGECESECGGGDDLCDFFVPPSVACDTCLAASCAGEYGSCTAD